MRLEAMNETFNERYNDTIKIFGILIYFQVLILILILQRIGQNFNL